MAGSSFKSGAAATEPPTSSTSSQGQKRPAASAGLPDNSPLPKRQATQHAIDPKDLTNIILTGKDQNSQFHQATLDMFSDPTVTVGLRASHFSYINFRKWAADELGIPIDAKVFITVLDENGNMQRVSVSSMGDFNATLVKIRTGIFTAPFMPTSGFTLGVSDSQPTVAPNIQPKVQTKQPEKPKENTPDSLIDLISDEPEETVPTEGSGASTDQDATPTEERVVPASEFFKLVREATGPNDPRLKAAVKDEPGADSRLFKIDPITFKKALIFFNTNLDENRKCPILGLKEPAHWWQVYTTYKMFMNPIENGVNGCIVALDVGFGKTRLAVLYILARACLVNLWEEVQEEWVTHEPNLHLPQGNPEKKTCCPSQENHMVQCPCVRGSDTRRVTQKYLTDTPALIMGPPALKGTWIDEASKAVVTDDKGNPPLTFHYLFADKTPGGTDLTCPKQKDQLVADTEGIVCFDVDTAQVSVEAGHGKATDVFLISHHMTNQLMDLYKKAGNSPGTCSLTFGVVFMDEYHKYKGSGNADTVPFDMVRKIARISNHPVTLFPMCGTTVEEGPGAWRAPAAHYLRQWRMCGWKDNDSVDTKKSSYLDCKSTTPNRLLAEHRRQQMQRLHKDLVLGIGKGTLNNAQMQDMARQIRTYLSVMVLALRQNQPWRGEILNELPPCSDVDHKVDSTTVDAETIRARDQSFTKLESLIAYELTSRKAVWSKDKANAEAKNQPFLEKEPTRDDVVEFQAGNENQTSTWLDLARASTFLYLLVLLASQVFPTEMFQSKKCQTIPVQVQNKIRESSEKPGKAIEMFGSWDFSKHNEKLRANCPKLKVLLQLIDAMVNDKSEDTAPINKSGKRDLLAKRYAIAYATQPLTASLMYYFLITNVDLCKKIKPILFTSQLSNKRRAEIIEEMGQDCGHGGRNKILIATTEIGAEGFNLQRVNNIWFMELPYTLTKYNQAVGRARRTGQEKKVNIVKMYDEGNLLESVGFRALKGKKMASELIYNVDPPEIE